MNNHKRGFTLVEVMIALSISLSILITLHYIPLRMMESFQGYNTEVTTNRDNHLLATAIHVDLKNNHLIKESENGFKIGPSIYTFTEKGVTRSQDGITLDLVDEELTFKFSEKLLTIQSKDIKEKKELRTSFVSLVFPLEPFLNVKGGES